MMYFILLFLAPLRARYCGGDGLHNGSNMISKRLASLHRQTTGYADDSLSDIYTTSLIRERILEFVSRVDPESPRPSIQDPVSKAQYPSPGIKIHNRPEE